MYIRDLHCQRQQKSLQSHIRKKQRCMLGLIWPRRRLSSSSSRMSSRWPALGRLFMATKGWFMIQYFLRTPTLVFGANYWEQVLKQVTTVGECSPPEWWKIWWDDVIYNLFILQFNHQLSDNNNTNSIITTTTSNNNNNNNTLIIFSITFSFNNFQGDLGTLGSFVAGEVGQCWRWYLGCYSNAPNDPINRPNRCGSLVFVRRLRPLDLWLRSLSTEILSVLFWFGVSLNLDHGNLRVIPPPQCHVSSRKKGNYWRSMNRFPSSE